VPLRCLFVRGIVNLFDIYLPLVDGALIFDNSDGQHELIADKQLNGPLNVLNDMKFQLLKNYHDKH
jgi:predicted ABC-type ATPase